jgi:plasmid stability protein
MLLHMRRTTLVLDPSLHAELKARAAAEGRTLTDVIEQALRAGLATRIPARRRRVTLPSYDLGPFLVPPGAAGAVADLRRGADPRDVED